MDYRELCEVQRKLRKPNRAFSPPWQPLQPQGQLLPLSTGSLRLRASAVAPWAPVATQTARCAFENMVKVDMLNKKPIIPMNPVLESPMPDPNFSTMLP